MICPVCRFLNDQSQKCVKCQKVLDDLNKYGAQIGSQNGEAGIIRHILDTIGEKDQTLIEIGFDKECNSVDLLSNYGWEGWLLDSDHANIIHGKMRWAKANVIEAHVTRENIKKIFKEHKVPSKVDMLAIDVDGIDYYLWEALKTNARLVVIEYNASFGPKASCVVEYDPNFNRFDVYPSYHGASLAALVKLAAKKKYALVGCEASGINAFFVKKNLLKGDVVEMTVPEAYYQHRNRRSWGFELVAMDDRGLKFVEV